MDIETLRVFPPMYTLQPAPAARQSQLAAWRSAVLSFATQHRISDVAVSSVARLVAQQRVRVAATGTDVLRQAASAGHGDASETDVLLATELFASNAARRAADAALVQAVFDTLVVNGELLAIPQPDARSQLPTPLRVGEQPPVARVLLLRMPPAVWADATATWALSAAGPGRGAVLTVHELVARGTAASPLAGVPLPLAALILDVLVRQDRVAVFRAADPTPAVSVVDDDRFGTYDDDDDGGLALLRDHPLTPDVGVKFL